MNIKINSIHFDADKKLVAFIENKIQKLTKVFDRIINTEVSLRIDNKNVENKIAKIRVEIPGSDVFAEKEAKTFEEAVDASYEALRKQLRKRKEKIRGL